MNNTKNPMPLGVKSGGVWRFLAVLALAMAAAPATAAISCNRTITADVVTIDMPILNSRLGASNVNGMMFALRRDVVPINPAAGGIGVLITDPVTRVQRRNAKLRDDKRPRPLVLRVAAGDCLDVRFQNLVAPVPNPLNARSTATASATTRTRSPQTARRRFRFSSTSRCLTGAPVSMPTACNCARAAASPTTVPSSAGTPPA